MSTDRIRELMEMWVHYRVGYAARFGGRGVLERARAGVPHGLCQACDGAGRVQVANYRGIAKYLICKQCGGTGKVRLDERDESIRSRDCPNCSPLFLARRSKIRGEIDGRTCHRCRGTGTITIHRRRVNPSFIPSTYRQPDNPICQRIDRLVCELRQREVLLGYWFVVHAEYLDQRGGTQAEKAGRIGLEFDAYRKRLQRSLEWIESALSDSRPVEAIPWPYKALDTPCHKTVLFSPS